MRAGPSLPAEDAGFNEFVGNLRRYPGAGLRALDTRHETLEYH